MHLLVALPEAVVGVDLLEPFEGLVQDQDESFDDGAVLETVDVPRVDDLVTFAHLGAGSITQDTLTVHSLTWHHVC